jgi:hypothetical protein
MGQRLAWVLVLLLTGCAPRYESGQHFSPKVPQCFDTGLEWPATRACCWQGPDNVTHCEPDTP